MPVGPLRGAVAPDFELHPQRDRAVTQVEVHLPGTDGVLPFQGAAAVDYSVQKGYQHQVRGDFGIGRAATSAGVKSPRRRDLALMLKALPPVMGLGSERA